MYSAEIYSDNEMVHRRDELIDEFMCLIGAPPWRSWVRNCTTSRKVAASITGGVIGNFSVTYFYGSGVDTTSEGNERQEYFLGG